MTNTMYETFIPDSSLAMQRQITMFLREAINSGKLKTGDKLPSSRKLAQVWNTNYFTVNSALKILVQEGSLLQKPRVGTIVKKKNSKLEKVGIYFSSSERGNREKYFYLVLQSKIQNILAAHGARCMTFFDLRGEDRMLTPMPELQEAVSEGKIDCVIAPLINQTSLQWLERLSIPRVALSSVATPFTVTFDTERMCELIVKRFVEINVKTMGVVTNVSGDYNCDGSMGFVGLLKKVARKYNMEFREEWSVNPDDPVNGSLTAYGYEAYKRLDALSEKPEGLVIYPDVVAIGAINAILECGTRIPEDMKLIVHQNSQCDDFFPFQVDRIMSEPEKIARIMVDKLMADVADKKDKINSVYSNMLIKSY